MAEWIRNLPDEVALSDENTVKAVRKSCDALTREEKEKLDTAIYEKLTASENEITKLKNEADPTPAQEPAAPTPTPEPAIPTPKPTTPASSAAPSKPAQETVTTGADGTAVGEGASETVAERAIVSSASDEGPAGTKFAGLALKQKKVAKKSITISWNRIAGTKYTVYGNLCGKGKAFKKLGTVSGTTFTQKKLKKGTYYKYLVVASKGGKVVSTSKVVHISTTGGKVGDPKQVTVNKKSVKIKKGKTFQIKAKQVAASKKLKVKNHRKLVYESSNPNVATVSKSGKVKGVKKGTAIIYVYAQNGVYAKVKVKVK